MPGAGSRLRELMRAQTVALPGAFNGMVARLAADKGFSGIYVSGAAISASAGVPDIGILTLDEFCHKIREIVQVSGLPILADGDTGFGEIEMVTRTVSEYMHAGAAGIHLEDQVFPKRCGHLDGKAVIPASQMIEKIRRAKRVARDPQGFVVCARTDARSVEGFDFAVERAKRYVMDAGADMIFPEGLADYSEFTLFAERMRALGDIGLAPQGGPFLLANMTEFGKTQYISSSDFQAAGYHAVIYPVSTFRCAMKAAEECLETLKREGSVEAMVPRMQTRAELSGRSSKRAPSPDKEPPRQPMYPQYYCPPYPPSWQPQQYAPPQYYYGPHSQGEEDHMQHPMAMRGSMQEDSIMSSHTVVQKPPPRQSSPADQFNFFGYGYSPSPSPGLADKPRGYTPNPSPQLSTRSASPLGGPFLPPKAPGKQNGNGEVFFAPISRNN